MSTCLYSRYIVKKNTLKGDQENSLMKFVYNVINYTKEQCCGKRLTKLQASSFKNNIRVNKIRLNNTLTNHVTLTFTIVSM
jgi:hypothetical protein